ncbi:hypothetical protein IJI55_01515, partial [Candidatus Saccharibacteria bacterium]|nr:hypothetical protein [Candidatus Saccharibacteria bacterium]
GELETETETGEVDEPEMVEEEEGSIDMAEVLEAKLNTFDIEKASKNEIASIAERLTKCVIFKQDNGCFNFTLIWCILVRIVPP